MDEGNKIRGHDAFPAMRRRIKGILMTGKQFSLDSRMDLVQGIMSHGGERHKSDPTAGLPLMEEDSVEGADSGQKPRHLGYKCEGLFKYPTTKTRRSFLPSESFSFANISSF
jgi:hypothetical protein